MWFINFCFFLRRGTSTGTGFLLELTRAVLFLDEDYCCEKPEHWYFSVLLKGNGNSQWKYSTVVSLPHVLGKALKFCLKF